LQPTVSGLPEDSQTTGATVQSSDSLLSEQCVGVKLDDTSSVRPKAKNAPSGPIALVSASAPWDDNRGRIAKFRGGRKDTVISTQSVRRADSQLVSVQSGVAPGVAYLDRETRENNAENQ
jgi:hypothetical protein